MGLNFFPELLPLLMSSRCFVRSFHSFQSFRGYDGLMKAGKEPLRGGPSKSDRPGDRLKFQRRFTEIHLGLNWTSCLVSTRWYQLN